MAWYSIYCRNAMFDVPLARALAYITPRATTRVEKNEMSSKAIHKLNSFGRTGFAMLFGLSRRWSNAVIVTFP
jgi:hypothetical protein